MTVSRNYFIFLVPGKKKKTKIVIIINNNDNNNERHVNIYIEFFAQISN